MSTDFQCFIDSVLHVPAEFERSMNLLHTLDKRVNEGIATANDLYRQYKQTTSKRERLDIRSRLKDLETRLESYGTDKFELAEQTYQLIDGTINQLIQLNYTKNEADCLSPVVGYSMPDNETEPKYCHCGSVSFGDMIACDNKDCPIEWFHYPCVGLQEAPKGDWYCSNCSLTIRLPKGVLKRKSTTRTRTPKRKRPLR